MPVVGTKGVVITLVKMFSWYWPAAAPVTPVIWMQPFSPFRKVLFVLLVAAIAIVTHKLNAVTPCQHNWEEHDHTVKCSKCGKKIPDYITATNQQYAEHIHEAA